MDLPASRKEAKAAGLTRYRPVKSCRRGHGSPLRDVRNGECLECRDVRAGKGHAARKLAGDWQSALTDAFEAARARPDFVTQGRVDYREPAELALLVGHVFTKPRKDDAAPSALTVVQEFGRALELSEAEREAAGAWILGVAEACGFAAPLGTLGRIAGRMPASLVTLSDEAEAQRAAIEAALAQSDIPEAMPSLTLPALGPVEISRNWDDIEAPPRPENESLITASVGPIQSTPWRVNQFMLDTLGKLAKVQSLDLDEDAHAASIGALEQARAVAEAPRFWYPCRLDWRGRIYQLGGRLQYTSGCDAARALLEFADGEQLTADGFAWLGVHVATCYGVRGSFMDRMSWTVAHTADILQTVADPLAALFWREAKEPYRFLAACDAWAQVERARGAPLSEQPHIRLPVASDATSSMLQHYALMARDADLAARVNMAGGALADAPRDFYAEAGAPVGLSRDDMKAAAWMLYGQTRNTLAVKLGTAEATRLMRGSDQFRALAGQVGKRRAAAILKAGERFARHARQAGEDKAKLIREAWADAAPSAMAEYERLRAYARAEVKQGLPLAWRLPDGFYVRQSNRVKESTKVSLWLWGHAGPWLLEHRRQVLTEAIDARAQADGYPPNYVHSHDAALLRAIIRTGAAHGVTRWGVAHDSVATHANDGGRLRDCAAAAVRWLYGCDGADDMQIGWYSFS